MTDKPPVDLEDIMDQEIENIARLKEKHGFAFGLIPEPDKPEEYDIMKKTYDSVGIDAVDDFRVMMGYISNPSVDMETKQTYIEVIPTLLDALEKQGKEVEYLRIAYEMVLQYGLKRP